MTLDEVMRLEGAALNEAVAERLGIPLYWHEYYLTGDGRLTKCGPYLNPQNSGESVNQEVPDFAGDWNAAMTVREWARGLERPYQRAFLVAIEICAEKRVGPVRQGWFLLDAETVDFARAALLVEP